MYLFFMFNVLLILHYGENFLQRNSNIYNFTGERKLRETFPLNVQYNIHAY